MSHLQQKLTAAVIIFSGSMLVFGQHAEALPDVSGALRLTATDTVAYWVERFGLPMSFSIVFIVGVWRSAKWIGPRAETWINSYLDNQKLNATTLSNLAERSLIIQEANSALLATVVAEDGRMARRIDALRLAFERSGIKVEIADE